MNDLPTTSSEVNVGSNRKESSAGRDRDRRRARPDSRPGRWCRRRCRPAATSPGRARTNTRCCPLNFTQVRPVGLRPGVACPRDHVDERRARRRGGCCLAIPVRSFGKPMSSMTPMMTTTMSISTSVKPLRRAVTVAPLGSIDPAPPARAGGPLLSQAAYQRQVVRDNDVRDCTSRARSVHRVARSAADCARRAAPGPAGAASCRRGSGG